MDKKKKLDNRLLRPSLFVLLIFLCNYLIVYASESKVIRHDEHLLKVIEDALKHINSVSSQFMQYIHDRQTRGAVGAGVRQFSGKVWLKRSGLMRWEYASPYRQVVIVGDKKAFLWEIEPNQVMIMDKDSFIHGLDKIFFSSFKEIFNSFSLASISEKKVGNSSIIKGILSYKGSEGFVKEIGFSFNSTTAFFDRIYFVDPMGSKTEIIFKDIKLNPKIDADMFKFVVPEGASVYYNQDMMRHR